MRFMFIVNNNADLVTVFTTVVKLNFEITGKLKLITNVGPQSI